MPRLDTLHVAALPYPTTQGTQAAIGAMVDALAREGRRTALLTYASGAGSELRFEHVVPRGLVRPRSLRSGPSIEKVVADVELARALDREASRADVVIAHHVEAAAIARTLRLSRWVFVAHTTLGPELPTYLPRTLGAIASRAGHALDRSLARVAPGLAAISTHVADAVRDASGREAVVLPVPFAAPLAPPPSREHARDVLGLDPHDRVVLYAGNLDAYQGLPTLALAMAELRATRPDARLLVASESAHAPFAHELERRGVRCRFAPLADEADRARVHAAADVVVVPRGTAGGFPIKLLDALARSVPVVAMRRALSGETVPGVRVTDDDSLSLARGLRDALDASQGDRSHRIAQGLAHLAARHDARSFVEALDEAIRQTHVGSR